MSKPAALKAFFHTELIRMLFTATTQRAAKITSEFVTNSLRLGIIIVTIKVKHFKLVAV